jgi:hypothetical protein
VFICFCKWFKVNAAGCSFAAVDNYLNIYFWVLQSGKQNKLWPYHSILICKVHAIVYTCALWSHFLTGSCQRYEDKIAQWDEGFAR